MVLFSKYRGVVVVFLAIAFASTSAEAEAEAEADECWSGIESITELRNANLECYKKVQKAVKELDKRDKLKKMQDRKLHWLLGEMQLKVDGSFTNEFKSTTDSAAALVGTKGALFGGVEFGYVQKKWLRDIMVARAPGRYLDRENSWAIEAATFTATVGYKRGLFADDDTDIVGQEFGNRLVYTVTGAYTLPFDKLFHKDID